MPENYPLLIERLQSTFIDTLVLIALMIGFTSILDHFAHVPDWVTIVLFASLIAYEPICMTFGCTLGNYVKKIRVRQESDTSRHINIFQAIIRYPVKLLLGWISFLTINSNPKRRAIHDLASGSVMIKV